MCPLPASNLLVVAVVVPAPINTMTTKTTLGKSSELLVSDKQQKEALMRSSKEIPQTVSFEDDLVVKTRASFSSSESSVSVESSSDLSTLDEVLVSKLGGAMEAVARAGDAMSAASTKDCFMSSSGRAPSISLRSYLRRMLKYIDHGAGSVSWTSLSAGARALITAIIYMDRIAAASGMVVNTLTIHRLLAAGILVALKMNEDAVIDMNFFATLAGVRFNEMRKLEAEFLGLLNWNTFISESEFAARIASFERLTMTKGKTQRKPKTSH